MEPECLSHQTAGPVAIHCPSDSARSDDPQPRRSRRLQRAPICDQTTRNQPLTLDLDSSKVPAGFNATCPCKPLIWRMLGRHSRAEFIPASGVCGPRGGGWPAWLCRSCSNCGSGSRAAVCGESSTVDIVSSYSQNVEQIAPARGLRTEIQPEHAPAAERERIPVKSSKSSKPGRRNSRGTWAGKL